MRSAKGLTVRSAAVAYGMPGRGGNCHGNAQLHNDLPPLPTGGEVCQPRRPGDRPRPRPGTAAALREEPVEQVVLRKRGVPTIVNC